MVESGEKYVSVIDGGVDFGEIEGLGIGESGFVNCLICRIAFS